MKWLAVCIGGFLWLPNFFGLTLIEHNKDVPHSQVVKLPCSAITPHATFEDGRDYGRAWKDCLSRRYCPQGWHYVYSSRLNQDRCSLTSIPSIEVPNSPNDPLDNWCCP